MPELCLLAVFGNPVFHSRSPHIFSRLSETQELKSVYLRVAAGSAEEVLSFAGQTGLSGFNITAPFKQEILPLLDKVERHAEVIGAVNAVKVVNGVFLGYNTDYIGVIEALKHNGADPAGKHIVILGAGGAARAAAYGMVLSRTKKVILVNRTREKAQTAAARLGCDSVPWEDRHEKIKECDILISCIPQHPVDSYQDILKKNTKILNADYKYLPNNRDSADSKYINGREWLLFQALPGFKLFTGYEAPHQVIPRIREDISQNYSPTKTNIALIGFMGSGKTAAGRELADKLGYKYVDTDTEIEHTSGKTIPDIFRESGEDRIRGMEKSLLARFLPQSKRTVFALGGGTIIDKENRSLIRENCLVIWLWAPVKTMLGRIDITTRPLLDPEKPLEQASVLLAERRPFYAAASDLVINTESGKTGLTVERIKNEIGLSVKN